MIRYKNHVDDWNNDNELGKKCFEGSIPLRRHPPTPPSKGELLLATYLGFIALINFFLKNFDILFFSQPKKVGGAHRKNCFSYFYSYRQTPVW